MTFQPEPRPAPARLAGVSRRAVVRAAAWSTPAIALVTAAPAWAASLTRFVNFDAQRYEWPDMTFVTDVEQPWVDGSIDYFIGPDEPGPSPAVVVHVTFPSSWTAGGRSVTVTHGGDADDFGAWIPSVLPTGGTILTTGSLSFTHPGGLYHGSFNEHVDSLRFTAWVAGVDLSSTTDPITLTYEVVEGPGSNAWSVAPSSSPAIVHYDGNWIAE